MLEKVSFSKQKRKKEREKIFGTIHNAFSEQ